MNLKQHFSVAASISIALIAGLTGFLTAPLPSQQLNTASHSQVQSVPDDVHWMPSFVLNGVLNGRQWITTLATDGTNLYAGGYFNIIGGVLADGVAMWNASTNRWSALGGGINASVSALAVDQSSNLYVCYTYYSYTLAGSSVAYRIAKWNGNTWEALGEGITGATGYTFVRSLAVDNLGNLYVGGSFSIAGGVPVNNIAKWNLATNSWSALGGGMNGEVQSLAVDGKGGVYAGGTFTTAGGLGVNNVARWNGKNWEALGKGITGATGYTTVWSLAVDHSGNLYAGGEFTLAGTVNVNNIARWDGNRWSSLNTGTNDVVSAIATDENGDVYAVGYFTMAGVISANYAARWNGNNWEALGSGTNSSPHDLAIDHSGNAYVSGSFTAAGDTSANGIARWDGQNWSVVGFDNGLNSRVYAIAVDKSNDVYAGGDFTSAGGKPANHIARWNGSDWSTLGEGITYCDGPLSCVLALSTDSNSNLYAGGTFTMISGINTNHIARWNGRSWSALSTGTDGTVKAIATDKSGNVYVGGSFSTAGGTAVNNIAKWNVSTNQWEALDTGLDGAVSALAVDRNGSLYAGGTFTQTGELAVNYVALWNGSDWLALGSGVCCAGINQYGQDSTRVSTLALDSSGNLYVGGVFTSPDSNVAMWDGNSWQALGGGVASDTSYHGAIVNTLAVDISDHLIVGGDITKAGDVPVRGIAIWDGNTWSALGSGLGGCYFIWSCVEAIAIDNNGNIYAGGDFLLAGGKPSANFAKWSAHIFRFYLPLVVR